MKRIFIVVLEMCLVVALWAVGGCAPIPGDIVSVL